MAGALTSVVGGEVSRQGERDGARNDRHNVPGLVGVGLGERERDVLVHSLLQVVPEGDDKVIAINQTKGRSFQFKRQYNVSMNRVGGIVRVFILPSIVGERPHSVVFGLSGDERHGPCANDDIHDDKTVLPFNNDVSNKALGSRVEERRGDVERVRAPVWVPITGLIHSVFPGRRRSCECRDIGSGLIGSDDGKAMSRTTRNCTRRVKLRTSVCLHIRKE